MMPLARPRIVVASFHPMFSPPSSGGEQRLLYLYSEISSRFDVDVVAMTYENGTSECIKHAEGLTEYRVPKPAGNDAEIWRLIQEGIGDECSGYVVGLMGASETAFGRCLRERSAFADIIVHETPYTLTSDAWAERRIPRVYMSHNNEGRLVSQILKGEVGKRAADEVRAWERRLVRESALVFATCEEERISLAQDYGMDPGQICLAPNGFRPEDLATRQDSSMRLGGVLFMGSRHPPNVEALEAIIGTIAPEAPELIFDVIGSVCASINGDVPANVRLHGLVSTAEKARLLAECAAAINPLMSGAGTNLKMLDYLGAGAPVVTTLVGARGLGLIDGDHARIVEVKEFASSLSKVHMYKTQASLMANRGRDLAFATYTWGAIAGAVADDLSALLSQRKRRLLSVSDYSVADPTGGGQVRIRALLESLAVGWDVDLLCLHDGQEIEREQLAPGFREIRVPKCDGQRAQQQSSLEGEWISIGDVVAGRWCRSNAAFCAEFSGLLGEADVLSFEQCFLADLLDLVPEDFPVVYSSQNIESELKRTLLRPRSDAHGVASEVDAWERRLLARAALVVCVSEGDRSRFRRLRPLARYVVVHNGVSLPVKQARPSEPAFSSPLAVFVGSAHPPNVEAATFIAQRIAPLCPGISFALVGNVCDALHANELPPNVLLLGRLDVPEKEALLDLADFAVNPMFSGGGSSLKVPDFWVHGLPLVSTRVGVRGFDCTDGRDVVLCERAEEFASALDTLGADPLMARRIGEAASLLASGLSWDSLAFRLRSSFERLLRRPARKRSVLVVTYRFGHPLRGGAEVYLDAVLREVVGIGDWDVTVVATACSTIENAFGFSAHYAPPSQGDGLPAWANAERIHLFPVDPPPDDLMARCAKLSTAWLARSRRLAERLVAEVMPYELGGGWHYPEGSSEGVARWMGQYGQVMLTAPGVLEIHVESGDTGSLVLRSPSGRRLESKRQGSPRGEVRFDVGEADVGLCTLECSTLQQAAGDPRELTLRITRMAFKAIDGSSRRIDLSEDAISRMARQGSTLWIRSLVEESMHRRDLEGFCDVRGPRSERMLAWIKENVSSFDVVLVQGVPFATVPDVVRMCRSGATPVIALPHAHIEDPYYHWPDLYRALADADAVIASPAQVASDLLEPIGATPYVLLGGGIDPGEFDERNSGAVVAAFRGVHRDRNPFILVLGRKTGAKRYDRVVAAHQRLLASGVDIDLVVIGHDEDRRAIVGPRTHYLGAQPRDVILGALRSAACLATMSESESFGIVIVEAWMSGTPVVANGGCLAFRQLIEHPSTGLLVETDRELDDALRSVLMDCDLALNMAHRGASAAKPYQWSAIARQVMNLLESVCRP